MSSAYHPQTDSASERTNKTVIQLIRNHVDRHQKGWAAALPKVCFDIMNAINSSTGFSPFQIHIGRSPQILPPLAQHDSSLESVEAHTFLSNLQQNVWEAQDNLLMAKISQASTANTHCSPSPSFWVSDCVMLATKNRCRDYIQKNDKHVAKFMPRFNGPYTILEAHPQSSTYTLDLPNSPNIYPTFHASQLRPFIPNDPNLFPSREHPRPGPVMTKDGSEECFIDRILDEHCVGHGRQYLVRWFGYGPEDDKWLPQRMINDCEVLNRWEKKNSQP